MLRLVQVLLIVILLTFIALALLWRNAINSDVKVNRIQMENTGALHEDDHDSDSELLGDPGVVPTKSGTQHVQDSQKVNVQYVSLGSICSLSQQKTGAINILNKPGVSSLLCDESAHQICVGNMYDNADLGRCLSTLHGYCNTINDCTQDADLCINTKCIKKSDVLFSPCLKDSDCVVDPNPDTNFIVNNYLTCDPLSRLCKYDTGPLNVGCVNNEDCTFSTNSNQMYCQKNYNQIHEDYNVEVYQNKSNYSLLPYVDGFLIDTNTANNSVDVHFYSNLSLSTNYNLFFKTDDAKTHMSNFHIKEIVNVKSRVSDQNFYYSFINDKTKLKDINQYVNYYVYFLRLLSKIRTLNIDTDSTLVQNFSYVFINTTETSPAITLQIKNKPYSSSTFKSIQNMIGLRNNSLNIGWKTNYYYFTLFRSMLQILQENYDTIQTDASLFASTITKDAFNSIKFDTNLFSMMFKNNELKELPDSIAIRGKNTNFLSGTTFTFDTESLSAPVTLRVNRLEDSKVQLLNYQGEYASIDDSTTGQLTINWKSQTDASTFRFMSGFDKTTVDINTSTIYLMTAAQHQGSYWLFNSSGAGQFDTVTYAETNQQYSVEDQTLTTQPLNKLVILGKVSASYRQNQKLLLKAGMNGATNITTVKENTTATIDQVYYDSNGNLSLVILRDSFGTYTGTLTGLKVITETDFSAIDVSTLATANYELDVVLNFQSVLNFERAIFKLTSLPQSVDSAYFMVNISSAQLYSTQIDFFTTDDDDFFMDQQNETVYSTADDKKPIVYQNNQLLNITPDDITVNLTTNPFNSDVLVKLHYVIYHTNVLKNSDKIGPFVSAIGSSSGVTWIQVNPDDAILYNSTSIIGYHVDPRFYPAGTTIIGIDAGANQIVAGDSSGNRVQPFFDYNITDFTITKSPPNQIGPFTTSTNTPEALDEVTITNPLMLSQVTVKDYADPHYFPPDATVLSVSTSTGIVTFSKPARKVFTGVADFSIYKTQSTIGTKGAVMIEMSRSDTIVSITKTRNTLVAAAKTNLLVFNTPNGPLIKTYQLVLPSEFDVSTVVKNKYVKFYNQFKEGLYSYIFNKPQTPMVLNGTQMYMTLDLLYDRPSELTYLQTSNNLSASLANGFHGSSSTILGLTGWYKNVFPAFVFVDFYSPSRSDDNTLHLIYNSNNKAAPNSITFSSPSIDYLDWIETNVAFGSKLIDASNGQPYFSEGMGDAYSNFYAYMTQEKQNDLKLFIETLLVELYYSFLNLNIIGMPTPLTEHKTDGLRLNIDRTKAVGATLFKIEGTTGPFTTIFPIDDTNGKLTALTPELSALANKNIKFLEVGLNGNDLNYRILPTEPLTVTKVEVVDGSVVITLNQQITTITNENWGGAKTTLKTTDMLGGVVIMEDKFDITFNHSGDSTPVEVSKRIDITSTFPTGDTPSDTTSLKIDLGITFDPLKAGTRYKNFLGAPDSTNTDFALLPYTFIIHTVQKFISVIILPNIVFNYEQGSGLENLYYTTGTTVYPSFPGQDTLTINSKSTTEGYVLTQNETRPLAEIPYFPAEYSLKNNQITITNQGDGYILSTDVKFTDGFVDTATLYQPRYSSNDITASVSYSMLKDLDMSSKFEYGTSFIANLKIGYENTDGNDFSMCMSKLPVGANITTTNFANKDLTCMNRNAQTLVGSTNRICQDIQTSVGVGTLCVKDLNNLNQESCYMTNHVDFVDPANSSSLVKIPGTNTLDPFNQTNLDYIRDNFDTRQDENGKDVKVQCLDYEILKTPSNNLNNIDRSKLGICSYPVLQENEICLDPTTYNCKSDLICAADGSFSPFCQPIFDIYNPGHGYQCNHQLAKDTIADVCYGSSFCTKDSDCLKQSCLTDTFYINRMNIKSGTQFDQQTLGYTLTKTDLDLGVSGSRLIRKLTCQMDTENTQSEGVCLLYFESLYGGSFAYTRLTDAEKTTSYNNMADYHISDVVIASDSSVYTVTVKETNGTSTHLSVIKTSGTDYQNDVWFDSVNTKVNTGPSFILYGKSHFITPKLTLNDEKFVLQWDDTDTNNTGTSYAQLYNPGSEFNGETKVQFKNMLIFENANFTADVYNFDLKVYNYLKMPTVDIDFTGKTADIFYYPFETYDEAITKKANLVQINSNIKIKSSPPELSLIEPEPVMSTKINYDNAGVCVPAQTTSPPNIEQYIADTRVKANGNFYLINTVGAGVDDFTITYDNFIMMTYIDDGDDNRIKFVTTVNNNYYVEQTKILIFCNKQDIDLILSNGHNEIVIGTGVQHKAGLYTNVQHGLGRVFTIQKILDHRIATVEPYNEVLIVQTHNIIYTLGGNISPFYADKNPSFTNFRDARSTVKWNWQLKSDIFYFYVGNVYKLYNASKYMHHDREVNGVSSNKENYWGYSDLDTYTVSTDYGTALDMSATNYKKVKGDTQGKTFEDWQNYTLEKSDTSFNKYNFLVGKAWQMNRFTETDDTLPLVNDVGTITFDQDIKNTIINQQIEGDIASSFQTNTSSDLNSSKGLGSGYTPQTIGGGVKPLDMAQLVDISTMLEVSNSGFKTVYSSSNGTSLVYEENPFKDVGKYDSYYQTFLNALQDKKENDHSYLPDDNDVGMFIGNFGDTTGAGVCVLLDTTDLKLHATNYYATTLMNFTLSCWNQKWTYRSTANYNAKFYILSNTYLFDYVDGLEINDDGDKTTGVKGDAKIGYNNTQNHSIITDLSMVDSTQVRGLGNTISSDGTYLGTFNDRATKFIKPVNYENHIVEPGNTKNIIQFSTKVHTGTKGHHKRRWNIRDGYNGYPITSPPTVVTNGVHNQVYTGVVRKNVMYLWNLFLDENYQGDETAYPFGINLASTDIDSNSFNAYLKTIYGYHNDIKTFVDGGFTNQYKVYNSSQFLFKHDFYCFSDLFFSAGSITSSLNLQLNHSYMINSIVQSGVNTLSDNINWPTWIQQLKDIMFGKLNVIKKLCYIPTTKNLLNHLNYLVVVNMYDLSIFSKDVIIVDNTGNNIISLGDVYIEESNDLSNLDFQIETPGSNFANGSTITLTGTTHSVTYTVSANSEGQIINLTAPTASGYPIILNQSYTIKSTGGSLDAKINLFMKNLSKLSDEDGSFMTKLVKVSSSATSMITGDKLIDLIELDDLLFNSETNKHFIITNRYEVGNSVTLELDTFITEDSLNNLYSTLKKQLYIFKPKSLGYVFTHKNGQNFTNNKPIVVPTYKDSRIANNGQFVWMISNKCNT